MSGRNWVWVLEIFEESRGLWVHLLTFTSREAARKEQVDWDNFTTRIRKYVRAGK